MGGDRLHQDASDDRRDDIGGKRERQYAEQGRENHSTGDLLFVIVELHGEDRADRSARAGFKQQHNLRGHAEADMQEAVDQQAYGRDQEEANADDGGDSSVPDHFRKIGACENHAGDHHAKRGIQPTDV